MELTVMVKLGMRRAAWSMFERFTDRGRRVVVLAQEEARMLNHNYLGTEHLLLGLLRESGGVAAKALQSLGIGLEAVRHQVVEIIGEGHQAPSGHIPFTPRVNKVLELSLREAQLLGHDYVSTGHLLLGLLREGDGVAVQVLVRLYANLNLVRQQVIGLLHGSGQQETDEGLGHGRRPSIRVYDAAALAQIDALTSELGRANAELDRLRAVLREHGINPGDGAA
jgi:ATP-dependent Clp protease ATP-binding subunit ClpA